MKRVVCTIVIFILLTIVIFPNSLATSDNGNQEIISSGHYEKGYRYNIQGWVYIHIEGEPYERGYQYGYLASAEIVDMIYRWGNWGTNIKIMKSFTIKNPEQWWELCKSKALRSFWKEYPDEYKQEIKGIADGVKARGGTIYGHPVGYEDILTANEFQDCWYSFSFIKKKIHPFRGIFYGLKNLLPGTRRLSEQGSCSAFAATGDATIDGRAIVAHSSQPMYYITERVNIILDVKPSQGNRFIMMCPPGQIWSNEDYYQNEKGIVLTETTLPTQGPWIERGIPIAVRTRKAIQYSDSIDDVLDTLLKGNNGIYGCEWLIADMKTSEIASIELALYNTPIKRTFNGFYWSCNHPHDRKVQREVYGIPSVIFSIGSKIFPDKFIDPRVGKFMELEEQYYGKIDTENAKKIMSTYPICRSSSDCKITDSELMENLGLLAFMGNPNGTQWNPTDEFKKKFNGVTELPTSGWVEIYPSKSQPTILPSTNKINYEEGKSGVLWQYETEFTRNIDYSSSVVSEDAVYAASSTGTVYALDADRNKLMWKSKVGDRAVAPAISNDLVFIGTDGGLHAIDKESGNVKWEQLLGYVSSKPVVTKNLVIAGCKDGNIYAFDIDSGERKWTHSFDDVAYISDVKHDEIYFGAGDSCYAFNIADRELIWKYRTNSPITAPPKINDNIVYVGSWDGNIYALDSGNGDLKWKYQTGWGIDSTPDVSDGTVFVGSLDNNFYALDEGTGELKWAFACKSAIHSSPVTYGEYVFFGCDDGRFYALNKTDGDLAWSFTPGYSINNDNANNYITTPILSSPVVKNGVVYFGAKGTVYALDAQTFETPKEKIEETKDYDMILIFIALAAVIVVLLLVYLQIRRKEERK